MMKSMKKDGNYLSAVREWRGINIVRWVEHQYTISLQYLTFSEAENIIKQCLEAKNRKLLTISKSILEEKGYVDMKTNK